MVLHIGFIEFLHESNTFTLNRTGLEAFRASRFLCGSEIPEQLRGTNTAAGGCFKSATRFDWKMTPIVAAHAQPGGPVTETARLEITNEVMRRLEAAAPFDAVFISLHGAMATESAQDGESQFLREVRRIVGDIPIAITLDLHANIFDEMATLVDIAISYRTYPHVDMADRAEEACELLRRTLSGEITPQIAIARPPMLVGCDDGRTTNDGPMCRILEQATGEMRTPAILNVAVNAGFTDADVHAAGPSVLVTFDKQCMEVLEARSVAVRICETIWSYRNIWEKPMDLEACIKHLAIRKSGSGPTVVADFSDNPGSGAYSDCTAILSALVDAGIENAALGALFDPEAAKILTHAGMGAGVSLVIGGKTDPGIGGGPLDVQGTVMALSDGQFTYEGPMLAGAPGAMGPSACLRVAGIDVLITSERIQLLDQNLFRAVGIEPSEKAVVVVKSMQHFRGAFAPIASEILVTDACGLCSPDVTLRNYENLRRPVFPLDDVDAGNL